MANTVPNPYNYQTPLGQALGNALQATGTALATGPTQWDQQKDQAAIDLAAAQAGEARAKTAGLTATNAAGGNLGTALKHGLQLIAAGQKPADAYNEIAPEVMQYFAELNPGNTDMGKNILSLYSQLPGVTEQGISQAQEGAGQAFNTTPVGAGRVIVADQAKQDSINSTSRQNNEADNAMRLLVEQASQAGQNQRSHFDVAPGATAYPAAGNPYGLSGPQQGNPTTETARGAVLTSMDNAGQFTDPNEPMVPGSPAAVAMGETGVPGQKTGKNWITNDGLQMGITLDGVTDAATGHPLPQGAVVAGDKSLNPPSASTGKNWASTDGQRGVTNDGKTDAATGKPLPTGWQYSTDVNPTGQKLKVIPAGAIQAMLDNKRSLNNIDNAVTSIDTDPNAIGKKGYAAMGGSMGMNLLNWADPTGVGPRAIIANIGSLLIHDRAGGSVTVSETPRLQPFIPLITDNAQTAKTKLSQLRDAIKSMLSDQFGSYSEDSGYIPDKVVGQFLDNDVDPQGGALDSGSSATDTATRRAAAQDAIAKGAAPQAVKDRFKQLTGQDL